MNITGVQPFKGTYITLAEFDKENKQRIAKSKVEDMTNDKQELSNSAIAEQFSVANLFKHLDETQSQAKTRDVIATDDRQKLVDSFEQFFREHDKTPEHEKTSDVEPFSWADCFENKSKSEKTRQALTPKYYTSKANQKWDWLK